MADKSIAQGQRIINRILSELEDTSTLSHAFAQAVLTQAVQNASARPTPQAHMAASGMVVEGDVIRSAGGTPGEVASSSEFGSDIYLQFHKPHNPRGYWLLPAASSGQAETAGDRAIEDVMQKVIRGF